MCFWLLSFIILKFDLSLHLSKVSLMSAMDRIGQLWFDYWQPKMLSSLTQVYFLSMPCVHCGSAGDLLCVILTQQPGWWSITIWSTAGYRGSRKERQLNSTLVLKAPTHLSFLKANHIGHTKSRKVSRMGGNKMQLWTPEHLSINFYILLCNCLIRLISKYFTYLMKLK